VAQSKPNEEVEKLYTARLNTYRACISFFRSREGIRALLESSEFLRPGLRALDAGAGFGTATFALLDALRQRRIEPSVIDAFDLTPAMLEQFQAELDARGVSQVRLKQGNVLTLWQFPPSWSDYNLIVSASMLEYLAKADLSQALSGLRGRLVANGTLLAVVTRKNWITKILIEWWWHAATYTRQELREAFAGSGFHDLVFIKFPLRYFWLNISNYVVVARCAG
jgi:ubiquinone/menaquinone biosynthesis C-methylase UbiE